MGFKMYEVYNGYNHHVIATDKSNIEKIMDSQSICTDTDEEEIQTIKEVEMSETLNISWDDCEDFENSEEAKGMEKLGANILVEERIIQGTAFQWIMHYKKEYVISSEQWL